MMLIFSTRGALVASALSFAALGLAAPATAQQRSQQPPITSGTSGGVSGDDVSASTCGQGTTDGTSMTVSGCADAEARNGGTAATSTRAQTNDHRAMQRSMATARDEDERARSRTHTVVRNGEVVRSRTQSMYKQRGEPPVRETTTSNARQQDPRR
jgi:hypothetical protein